MKPRINMITLGTRQLERATAFYAQGLGFPKRELEGDISFFELQGTWLALYPWELLAKDALVDDALVNDAAPGFRGVTLAHNVADESQVIKILEAAKRAGAPIVKPAQPTDWGGFSGYFQDLDAHLWEVAFNPFFWPGPK
jgi:uncharacterized protein